MKAAIITPAYSHVDARTQEAVAKSGLPWLPLYGFSDLPRVRSLLVSVALEKGAERIIFLDADVAPSAAQLKALSDAEEVGPERALFGLYPLRSRKTWSVQAVDHTEAQRTPLGGSFEIDYGGLGLAVVSRESLLRVQATLPELREDGRRWHPFCVPTILSREGQHTYLADDRSLCHRLRSTGTRLWCRTDLNAGHVISALITEPDQ